MWWLGAWVAEVTGLIELRGWPAGTRLILRKERPHPGAQRRITDADGLRITGFLTNIASGGPGRNSPTSNYATAATAASRTRAMSPNECGCTFSPPGRLVRTARRRVLRIDSA